MILDNAYNRKQWIKEKLLNLPSGWRILDAGAGEQQYRQYCSHLNYVSQDFSQYIPENNSEGLHLTKWDYGKLDIISDITSIPEPDHSFDAIMCNEVFEHIADPIAAIKEFNRLLKPGGYLILTAPFNSLTHFAPHYYYTGFSKYFYEYHLPKNNFIIKEIEYNGSYFHSINLEVKRLPGVAAQYANYTSNRIEYFMLRLVNKYIEKIIRRDSGSYELSAWGLHIFAQKEE